MLYGFWSKVLIVRKGYHFLVNSGYLVLVHISSGSCMVTAPKSISSIATLLTALPVDLWPTAFVNYPAALSRIVGLPIRAFVSNGIAVLG